LVIIDVEPKELGIPTKAYYAVEEVKEVQIKSFISLIEFLYFCSCCYFAKVILLHVIVGGELVFAQH